jgi:TRAP-type C4-dicarboxylate transport system permease small subunit
MTRLRRLADLVGAALFAALFATFIYATASRFLLNRPITWGDELAAILMLWATFWAAALMIAEKDHVAVDVVYVLAPPRGQRVLGLVASIGFGLLFLAALPATWDYIAFLWRERTSVLRIRLDWLYLCFALFVAAVAARLLWRGWRLFGARWREHL